MFTLMTQHDEFVAELLARFSQSTNWTDAQISAMTTLLADAFGDLGVADAYAIRFAAREAFSQLCLRDSSAIENAKFLGAKITRKSPATVTAKLTNSTLHDVLVDKWDEFDVNGRSAYATSSTVIKSNETKDVVLTLGSVTVKAFDLSSASDYFYVNLGETGFNVCYLEVWTESASGTTVPYTAFDGAMFDFDPGDAYYLDRTTQDGDVELRFGGQLWGRVPDRSHTLKVRYATTNGASDNLEFSGLIVTALNIDGLKGKTSEFISGGADQVDTDFYRQYAPYLSRSKNKAIRDIEWRAAVMAFPDVADCVVLSQRDIAPNDPSWMSVVRVCVLPKAASSWGGVNPNPTSAQWETFLAYLEQYKGRVVVQTWNPSKLLIDLYLEVYVFSSVDRTAMEATLTKDVSALFERRRGSLGRKIALNDIMDAVRFESSDTTKRRAGIDYATVVSPTQDVSPNSRLEYVGLRNLRITVKYTDRE
jgi:hypothetical protein